MAGLAGCSGGSGGGTGTLSTSVKDQPGDIADFESCVVTIVGMWLGPTGSGDATDTATDGNRTETTDTSATGTAATDTEADDDSNGREYYEFDEPEEADLVQLQGENTQLVDERELETAEYRFLQLDTDGIEAVLDDGSAATVETPGEAPLKFDEPFEIREDTRTSFTADFTPVKRGQTDSYLLQPVAKGVTVDYESG